MPDIEPAPNQTPIRDQLREKLLARPDIDKILGERDTRESLRQKLLARDDIDEILGRDKKRQAKNLSDVPNPSRRRFLKTAAAAAVAGAALGGGIYSQLGHGVNVRERGTQVAEAVVTKIEEKLEGFNEEAMIQILSEEALKRRAERRKQNPAEFDSRVNAQINEHRVNIVLFGYGPMMWYEAGVKEGVRQDFRGSHSIISIDTRTGKANVITLTGQTLAPEIRKYKQQRDDNRAPFEWIDKAFHTGGFDLQQSVIEDMTGLSADFQIVLRDDAIKTLIDDVFGGLKVDVPIDFATMPFIVNDQIRPGGHFPKEKQTLDGVRVIEYIKALAKNFVEGNLIYETEPNPRKHLIFKELMKAFKTNKSNPLFLGRLLNFLRGNITSRNIETDFDPIGMLRRIPSVAALLKDRITAQRQPKELSVDKTIYIQDSGMGADGGLAWLDASDSQFIKKARDDGLIPDYHMSVPYGNVNPNSTNLVKDFWQSTRDFIKSQLIQPQVV